MKLFRFGTTGQEKPGVITGDKKLDVSAFGEDFNEAFFASSGIDRLRSWLSANEKNCPEVSETVRLGAPVSRPSKIICIGLNYADHARETNAQVPEEPIIFFKATTALCGPDDDLLIPRGSTKLDWEVELAVIIGKEASYVSEEDASRHIAGYALHNDYSERAFQLERSGQWVKGKSCDTFAPLGPFLATPDEVGNIDDLGLWLTVNGRQMQESNTRQLIFKIPYLIHYLSGFMTLLPGDIISTGTPHGVGMGFDPPVYLKEGDVVELGIDGLGSSRQQVKAFHR